MKVFSDEERAEIEAEIRNSYNKRAACPGVLKIIQKNRGYVSDEMLREAADILDMSADELDSTAGFYSLIFRKPVGKHILKVCDSVSCWVMGGDSLLSFLEKKLGVNAGETTADGCFTLLPISCLGECNNAPAIMLDDEIIGNVTPELLDKIIAEKKQAEQS